jgi:NAD(P)-dependent dehydrogenase (short-subunit alcohol dehydrogenase family)
MKKPQFDLEGRCALVTGATGGIGSAAAKLLAAAGARLVVSGTNEQKLEALRSEISQSGGQVAAMASNVIQPGEPAQLVEESIAEMGRLDILVNALGVNRPQKHEEVTEENWDTVLDLNLKAVFLLCQAAGRHMIQRGVGGRMVNVSSQTGTVALPLRAAYCASKAGVDQLSRALALDWAGHGITVNTVAPTFVETPFVAEMFKDPAFKQYALDNIPLGRMATPEEVGYAILYLVCDFASIITGHVLLVDGGWTVK